MKTCPQCDTGYPDSQTACPIHGHLLDRMRKRKITVWFVALILAVAALPAMAQSDEGPILLPKPKPVAKPAKPSATLLVMCDLTCNWKLDGKAFGRIAAGDSVTAPLSLGKHLVDATTLDGLDEVKKEIEIKTTGQMNVNFALQSVQAARLKTDQEARDKAVREQQERDTAERVAKDKAAREQQEREWVAHELSALTWIDPATGLRWTKTDNGSNVTWQQAMDYCRNLQLAGHSDWRLATIEELQGIYEPNANVGGWQHVKGNLQLSGWFQWSSSQGDASGEAWDFGFYGLGRYSRLLDDNSGGRALCVRRSGE
jgi:Protein of unknown function (DUF1566)